MPHSSRSLAVTDAYRKQLSALGGRVEAQARRSWPRIEQLDDSRWAEVMAQAVTRAQTESVRLSAAYLAAYLRSEGARGTAPVIDSRTYAGVSRDGRPLAEAFQSPLIAVRKALSERRSPDEALAIGLAKGVRFAAFETVQAGRDATLDAIEADERFKGWQRVVAGSCAACEALSGTGGPRFEVHPNCECQPAPVVVGVPQRISIPTGAELFRQKTKAEQEAAVGIEAAQMIRDGDADLRDFVKHERTDSDQDNWITQRPVQDVAT